MRTRTLDLIQKANERQTRDLSLIFRLSIDGEPKYDFPTFLVRWGRGHLKWGANNHKPPPKKELFDITR